MTKHSEEDARFRDLLFPGKVASGTHYRWIVWHGTSLQRLNNSLLLCYVAATSDYSRRRSRRSEEHTSELQSRQYLVCRLLLEIIKQYIGGRPLEGGRCRKIPCGVPDDSGYLGNGMCAIAPDLVGAGSRIPTPHIHTQ